MWLCVWEHCTIKPYVCVHALLLLWTQGDYENLLPSFKILDWSGMGILGDVTRGQIMKGGGPELGGGEWERPALLFDIITLPH